MKASSLSTAYICVYTRTYTRVLSYVYSSKDIEVASSENGKNGTAKALKYSRKRDRWPVSKGTLTFFRMLDGGEAAVRRQVEQQRPVSGQLLEPAREEYLYLAVGRLVQQVLVRIVPPRGPLLLLFLFLPARGAHAREGSRARALSALRQNMNRRINW